MMAKKSAKEKNRKKTSPDGGFNRMEQPWHLNVIVRAVKVLRHEIDQHKVAVAERQEIEESGEEDNLKFRRILWMHVDFSSIGNVVLTGQSESKCIYSFDRWYKTVYGRLLPIHYYG